jgi:hypothetical protein
MLLHAAVYGLDSGSLMLASSFDYLFHMIAGYFSFLKLLTLIMSMSAAFGWVLDVSLFEQEMCGMLSYFIPRDCLLVCFYF